MMHRRGFSMVELLVALALTGILMGGLSMVFKSTISSFYQSGDTLGAQRRARWAFAPLEDDLRMAGHTDGLISLPTGVNHPPLLITPGGTEDRPLDSVEFFMNMPVEECELMAPGINADSNQMVLKPIGKKNFISQAGDYFFLRDGFHSEDGLLATAPTKEGLVTIMSEEASQASPTAGLISRRAVFHHNHLPSQPDVKRTVMILRPLQMVRYSIENLRMDPDPKADAMPCLVRRQADYSLFSRIQWDSVPFTLVSENVSSLMVDLSVDGGTTWTRRGATTWDDMRGRANGTLPAGRQIDDREFWFKSVPVLLRVNLTTRTAVQREEYSQTAGNRDYRERSLVLMIAPRNCGLP